MEIEIGRGKKGRRAYGLDEIAIVPSRRTRDPEDVDLSWQLGPYRLDLPLLASAMDGVVSPRTAAMIGKLGGLGVINLEGIQVRYEEPDAELDRIATFSPEEATRGLQEIYREPIRPDLIHEGGGGSSVMVGALPLPKWNGPTAAWISPWQNLRSSPWPSAHRPSQTSWASKKSRALKNNTPARRRGS